MTMSGSVTASERAGAGAGAASATAGAEAGPAGAPASPLAASPPGKRDTRIYEKGGKYKPVAHKKSAASGRKRSSMYGTPQRELASSTRRNISMGADSLKSLGLTPNSRFSEGKEPTYYDEQEKIVFEENYQVKNLIESLEKNNDEAEPQ